MLKCFYDDLSFDLIPRGNSLRHHSIFPVIATFNRERYSPLAGSHESQSRACRLSCIRAGSGLDLTIPNRNLGSCYPIIYVFLITRETDCFSDGESKGKP